MLLGEILFNNIYGHIAFALLALLFLAYGRNYYLSRAPGLYKGCMIVAGLAWMLIMIYMLDSIWRVPLILWSTWFIDLTVICMLAGMTACSWIYPLIVFWKERRTEKGRSHHV